MDEIRNRLFTACQNCGSRHIDTFGTNPGEYQWQLCRDCGEIMDKNTPRKEE